MKITRNCQETNSGPSDWFTGTVYLDMIATPTEPSRLGAASVHFTPGARTAWHTHPFGQTIYVTEGIGRCQRRGGEIEEIRAGDRVYRCARTKRRASHTCVTKSFGTRPRSPWSVSSLLAPNRVDKRLESPGLCMVSPEN
jgi:quercetin dioxygenase-like cupin family protein